MGKLDRKVVGRNIKTARERQNLKQWELAEKADISTESLSRIERGAWEPSLSTFMGVARGLKVTVDQLLDGSAPTQHNREDPTVRQLLATAMKLPPEKRRGLLAIARLLAK